MIVTNSTREKNTVSFDVTLDAAEFEVFVNKAYQKNKSKIAVTGFRKGHAPRMVVEGMYGKDVFYDDAMNDAAPQAFAYAAMEEKLDVVGRPSVEKVDVTEEKGLALSFKVDVWPEVKLGEYKGLEAEKPVMPVTEEDIDKEVERLRKQNARMEAADREARLGDSVRMDYKGTLNGVAFDGGTAEDYTLLLGSGSFVPGFEDKLVGIKAGEERDIDITFPENYTPELAGKDVVFHIVCHEVKEEILPELDDEFAKDHDNDTMAELRESIRTRLTDMRKDNAETLFAEALVNKASENMEVEIPAGMVEEHLDSIVRDYEQYMYSQGIHLQDYLQMIGSDMEKFRENSRPAAEKQSRTEVLFRAVAEAEKLEVSEEEIDKEYADIAEKYGMKLENARKNVAPEMIRNQLMSQKALRFIVDNGVAVEAKEAAEAEAEPSKEE